MEYKLNKTTTKFTCGATLQSDNTCTETLKSFGTIEEALEELKKYKLEISEFNDSGVKNCTITEYIVEKTEYCNGEMMREFISGEVADLSKLNIKLTIDKEILN